MMARILEMTHTSLDHVLYSALGGAIAIESAGLADLTWRYYFIIAAIGVLESFFAFFWNRRGR